MEKFSLEKWLQDKSRKVCTRDGREVEILKTDFRGYKQIIGVIKNCDNKDDEVEQWDGQGYFRGLFGESKCDLFFAEEEKTNKILDELKSYLEKTPKEQVEKDWKEIQEWYNQYFANESNEEEKLTEFEKRLASSLDYTRKYRQDFSKEGIDKVSKDIAKELLDLARKELENNDWRQSLMSYKDAYEQGKRDALKDLPKWKEATEHKDFEKHIAILGEYSVSLRLRPSHARLLGES